MPRSKTTPDTYTICYVGTELGSYTGTLEQLEKFIAENKLDVDECVITTGVPVTVTRKLAVVDDEPAAPVDRPKRKYTRRAKVTNGHDAEVAS